MSRLRILLLAFLAAAPFVFLMGVGSYHLWETRWNWIAWWPMAASLTLAYLLGWRWTRKRANRLLPGTGTDQAPMHWTDRDRAAWQVVEARAAAVERVTSEQMADANRYAAEAIALALDVARVYKPGATDPFGHLTLPEVLACGELVSRDLSLRVNKYVPGSHLLSIDDWKRARTLVDWGQRAWNISWLARIIYNPVNASAQFLASKAGGKPLDKIQDNVMLWFYTAWLHELGRYLIELNSGRLKVGAERYRELVETKAPLPGEPEAVPLPVTVALVGQVKAGKSSLVNAMLGEERAKTDVLPVTPDGTTYELNQTDAPRLTLIDTAGYGQGGPTEAELQAAMNAAQKSDVLLMVTPARTAARRADVEFLEKLIAAFKARPHLKLPPIVVAVSQIDLLTPAVECSPPY